MSTSFFKKLRRLFSITVILIILLVVLSNLLVEKKSDALYDSEKDIPTKKVGLVLGTSKYLRDGRDNLFYRYRIEAAVKLFKAGKIKYILVSGDNRQIEYNEPMAMKKDLIARGIPEDKIVLDYAGFRTLDSVIRAWKVFGQSSFTIISQPFHNKRAVYIANHEGLEVVAFNARKVAYPMGVKTRLRELFARVKLMLDLYVLDKQPHFLGESVVIS